MRNPFTSPEIPERFRLYEAAFAHASIGMAIVNSRGVIIEANDALADFLGYSLGQLSSGKMTISDITHPDYVRIDEAFFEDVLSGRRDGYQIEKLYLRADGTTRWGRLNVAKAGHLAVTVVVGQVEDIQELKEKNERLLEINQELIESNERLKGVLKLVGKDKHEELIKQLEK